jgi:hypothetical protein
MNTPEFSIETWVRYASMCSDGTGSGNDCTAAGANFGSGYTGYALTAIDTQPLMTLAFYINSKGYETIQHWLQGPTIDYETWYHVVGTFDGTTQKFFVDGNEFGSQQANYVPDASSAFTLFGLAGNKTMENGTIDEVAYYNYALGADRVENHYQTGIGVVPEPNTALLLGVGLVGLGVKRRRRQPVLH